MVADHGAVGQNVMPMLHDADEGCVVIDRESMPGVDLVGSELDRVTLGPAGVRAVSAVELAWGEDRVYALSRAVVRDDATKVPLMVRVLRTRYTSQI